MKDATTIQQAITRFSDAAHEARTTEREITKLRNARINADKAKAAALDELADTLKVKLGPNGLGDLLRRFRGHPALKGAPPDTDNYTGGVP